MLWGHALLGETANMRAKTCSGHEPAPSQTSNAVLSCGILRPAELPHIGRCTHTHTNMHTCKHAHKHTRGVTDGIATAVLGAQWQPATLANKSDFGVQLHAGFT